MRWILTCALLLSPLAGDHIGIPLFAIAAGALMAHDGLMVRNVVGSLALMLLAELMWGIDLGTLSLAYILTALALRLVDRFVTFVPLASEPGWSLSALIRSGLYAVMLAWCMSVLGVLVEAVVYQRGEMGVLLAYTYRPLVAMVPIATVVLLVVLHRIQTPFHRKMIFSG